MIRKVQGTLVHAGFTVSTESREGCSTSRLKGAGIFLSDL